MNKNEPLYDFPVSPTFRNYENYWMTGQLYDEPEPSQKPISPPPREVIHRHSNMGEKEFDLLQQTARRAEHLQKQLAELSNKRKGKRYSNYD